MESGLWKASHHCREPLEPLDVDRLKTDYNKKGNVYIDNYSTRLIVVSLTFHFICILNPNS